MALMSWLIFLAFFLFTASGFSPHTAVEEIAATELRSNGQRLKSKFDIKSNIQNTRNANKRYKRLGIFDVFTFGIGMGFDTYGLVSGILDGQEQEKQMEEVLDKLEKNFEAIHENFVAINNVGHKVDDVMAAIVKFDKETYEALTDIRREILKANAETQTALGEIRLDIFKLNRELLRQFEGVHTALKELQVGDKISSLLTFMEYFWQHVATIEQLSSTERVFELERTAGVLLKLEEAVGPSGLLHANLYHILNERLAYPRNEADVAAYATLTVLYHGIQTYVSTMFFVVEQQAFLADFYYQHGDVDNCNKYLMRMLSDFKDFRVKLGGSDGGTNGLIQKVLALFKEISELPFVLENSALREIFLKQAVSLQQSSALIDQARLPLINQQPDVIKRKPDFSASGIATPIGKWQKGAEVSYAIQFNSNGSFSKIGPWSEPYTVSTKASPKLFIPRDSHGRRRLIFRKFKGHQPQWVGTLEAAHQTRFHDINRDLFNAAGNLNEEIALQEFEIYLKHGAELNVTFEDNKALIHAASGAGNTLLIEQLLLLNASADVVNAKDAKGNAPLHIAADVGYEYVVELLLKHGANVNAVTELAALTPLHIAALKGYELVIEALLASNETQINKSDAHGFRPLHSAVLGGVYAVEALLAQNETAINSQSKAGLTPLQLSVLNGNVDVLQMLLDCAGIDLNVRAAGNFTALHFAVMQKSFEQFELLLRQPEIAVNAAATNNWTPLHFVVALQQPNMLSALLQHLALDVNARAAGNVTALHLAAKLECLACLEQLLNDSNVNVDATAVGGMTPLHIAALYGRANAVAMLIESGAALERTANYEFQSKFCYYAKQQNLTFDAKQNCATVEATKYEQLTPLLLASISSNCNAATLEVLIERGANLTMPRINGSTFEFLAAQHGTLECVNHIFEKFDGLKLRSSAGDSLLHYAVRGHNWPVLQNLIESNKFDINVRNLKGETPLHWATLAADGDAVKYLLVKGAAVNAATQTQQETSLHFAVKNNEMEIIDILTSHGADINAEDATRKSPLHYAVASNKSQELTERLLKGNSPATALCAAVRAGGLEVTHFLFGRFEKLAAETTSICPVMHVAARNGSLEIMKALVEHGLSVKSKDPAQFTALHYAAQADQLEVVKYLLAQGADVNAAGKDKQTPLHLAFINNKCQMAKYLLEVGHARAYERDNFQKTVVDYAVNSKCKAEILPYTTTTTTTTTTPKPTTTKKPKKCHMGPMSIFYGPTC